MKKNIYPVQVNASFEGSVYLPYAAGALIACALESDFLRENYDFKEIIYLRKDIEETLEEIENPFVMAFSNYIWNYEYNKALAKKVKEKYPECHIIFGGHNIAKDTDSFDDLPFADFLVFGEGEEPFKELLKQLCSDRNFDEVPNIAYKTESGERICTYSKSFTDIEYPSPYASGVFDSIAENAPFGLSAILETNRGCPFSCAFCDWGMLKSKIRCFPFERVLGDIKWMAEHKIEYCYCADSNFGIFERDTEIVDFVIETYRNYGYPQKFRVNFMKNSDDKVYEINRRLFDAGMNKGVTLSFQSMCPETLEIIGRKNISIDRFRELLVRYEKTGIAAYSELILGLPGETYESFCNGIEKLFEAGQHSSLFVYNCELLVNSKIGNKEFRDKYKIETARTPFNQDHFEPFAGGVCEYSNIIVSTSSMSRNDWVKTSLFSVFVQALHCLGLLQCAAIYLFFEQNVKYVDFYKSLLDAFSHDGGLCGTVYSKILEKLTRYAQSSDSWSFFDERFGKISWPIEEGIFLELVSSHEEFYSFAKEFMKKYISDSDLIDELIGYQQFILKKPDDNCEGVSFNYDFHGYFEKIYIHEYEKLLPRNCTLSKKSKGFSDMKEYAKNVVWFGRRSDKTLSTDIEKVTL